MANNAKIIRMTPEAAELLVSGLRKIHNLKAGGNLSLLQSGDNLSLFVSPSPAGGSTSPAAVGIYMVQSIENDFIYAKAYDGTRAVGSILKIAKPRLLQHTLAHYPQLSALTTIDPQTVDVAAGTETGRWVVTPNYAPGDLITAAPRAISDLEIAITDLNLDARAWCQLPEDDLE